MNSQQVYDVDGGKKRGEAKKAGGDDDDDDSPRDKPTKKELTMEERDAWLKAKCVITLTETPTFFILEKADAQVPPAAVRNCPGAPVGAQWQSAKGHSVIPAPPHHQNSVGTCRVQRVAQ